MKRFLLPLAAIFLIGVFIVTGKMAYEKGQARGSLEGQAEWMAADYFAFERQTYRIEIELATPDSQITDEILDQLVSDKMDVNQQLTNALMANNINNRLKNGRPRIDVSIQMDALPKRIQTMLEAHPRPSKAAD